MSKKKIKIFCLIIVLGADPPPKKNGHKIKSCILKPSQDNGAPLSVIKIVNYCGVWEG